MQRPTSHYAVALLPPAGALLVGLTTSADHLQSMGLALTAMLVSAAALAWFGSLPILMALLTAGYFAGWIKLRYTSWIGYALPDGLCCLLLAHAFLRRAKSGSPLPRNGLTLSVLLLTLYCLLQLLNPGAPLLRSLAGLRSWLLYTWLLFAGYEMLQSGRQLKQIYGVMLMLSTMTALYGIYQWRQGPAALMGRSATLDFFAERMTWGGGREGNTTVFRAFSTFVMPGSLGTNMAFGLLVALVVLGAPGTSRWLRGLAVTAIPLMAAGMVASGSRSALVLLVLALLVFVVLRRGRSTGVVLLLTGAAMWAAISLTTSLISLRYATLLDLSYVHGRWLGPLRYAFTIVAQNPFGKGMGYAVGMPVLGRVASAGSTSLDTYAASSLFHGIETTNIDSGIGVAAAELGFPGLLIFLVLLVNLLLCPWQSWRRTPDGPLKELLTVPVILAAVYALTAVVSGLNASLPQSIYFWLLIGMTLKAPSLGVEEPEASSSAP